MPWQVAVNNVTPTRIERVIDFEGQGSTPSYRFIAQGLSEGGYQLHLATRAHPYADWETAPTIPITILDHIFNIMHEARTLWCKGQDPTVKLPSGTFGEGSVLQWGGSQALLRDAPEMFDSDDEELMGDV